MPRTPLVEALVKSERNFAEMPVMADVRFRFNLRLSVFATAVFAAAVAIAGLLAFGSQSAEARRIERLRLEPNTMAELSVLLSHGDDLHTALTKQEDEQIEVTLRDIQVSIARTMSASIRVKMHERAHLMKILESMAENVEIARNSGLTERRERISDVFNMMANVVRIYNVDARFKIFFCSRDKMTWIQTKARGVYPFPELNERECALRAP